MTRLQLAWKSPRRIPVSIALLAFALALWQRPRQTYSDTRIELLEDPVLFLSRVGDVWSSTFDLGHVQISQFVGYLWPMGPFFALGDVVGLPMWIVQRLWIGSLLAIGAVGVVSLMSRLYRQEAGIPHLVAGLLYLTSPFVLVVLNRGTSWLLPFAVLPWLLLWTHRGLERPTGWRAPAALGLLFASAGGGLNAALVVYIGVGVVALM